MALAAYMTPDQLSALPPFVRNSRLFMAFQKLERIATDQNSRHFTSEHRHCSFNDVTAEDALHDWMVNRDPNQDPRRERSQIKHEWFHIPSPN